MINFDKLKSGSIVLVQTRCDGVKRGTVDDIEFDGKDGSPTIGYVDAEGEGYWAYFDQIKKVISY